jgi:hypothetical protein
MPVNPKKTKPKPRKVTPKKKTTTTRPRIPTNRNTNSVRVHIINGSDSGSAPPPYVGPDRSYFAFNPVFDIGLQKTPNQPPMNTGDPISAGPIKRAVEIPTQVVDNGLFNTFLSRTNSSMSMGSGLEIGQSSSGMQTDPMMEDWDIKQLRAMARSIGVPYDRKTSRIQLIENIKVSNRKGKNKKNV